MTTAKLISNSVVDGAYRNSQDLKVGSVPPVEPGKDGASFADLVRGAAEETATTIREAETVATAGLTGQASTQQVVEATLELETTVKMAVSMRDKLVEAYQEIMRMPV